MKSMKSYIRALWSPTAVSTVVLVAAMVFAPAAGASPISYTINFTLTSGLAPTSGSFIYDAAQPSGSQFSAFLVSWDNATIDLTSNANAPTDNPDGVCGVTIFAFMVTGTACTTHTAGFPRWNGAVGFVNITQFSFTDINSTGGFNRSVNGSKLQVTTGMADATGTWTSAATATVPEPSSLILALVAGASLLFLRLMSPDTKTAPPNDRTHHPLP